VAGVNEERHSMLVFAVQRLHDAREAAGGRLPAGWLDEMAASCDIGRSTLLRYLADGVPAPHRRRSGWSWGPEARAAYYRAAGDVTFARRLLVEERGAGSVPSLPTMYRTAERDFAPDERARARHGAAAARGKRLVVAVDDPHRNATWLGDHSQLDVDVVPNRGSVAVRPWMTVFEDGYSRRIVGASLSITANQGHVLSALGMGIRTCGTPLVVLFDRGREFLATAVREQAGVLGYAAVATPAYHPHYKGKVERLHQTVNRMLAHELGTTPSVARDIRGRPVLSARRPVSLDALTSAFFDVVDHYNTQHHHRELQGTPQATYDADPTPERHVEDALLRRFLLTRQHRKIGDSGIRFRSRVYWAAELEGHRGEPVEIRFAQDDQRRLEVYTPAGTHWCTAQLVDPASPEQRDQVLAVRHEHTRRQKADLQLAKRRERRRWAAIDADRRVEESTVITAAEHQAETTGVSPEMTGALRTLGLATDLDNPDPQAHR
jgi:putative transposase